MIQKIFKYICEKSTALSTMDIPSKRYIMKWCLIRGYSVFTDGKKFFALNPTAIFIYIFTHYLFTHIVQ